MEAKKTIGNVTLDIYDAGEYNIDGKKIPHGAEIKIKVGKAQLKISARELLALKACMADEKVRKELTERYNQEEQVLKDMKF